MCQRQQICWFMLAALVVTAAGNTHSTSKSARKQQKSGQSAASPNAVSHDAAEVDAETFTGTNVTDKKMNLVEQPSKKTHATPKKRSGKLQQGGNAAQKNPINNLNKILKKAGDRAENAISNTFKGVGGKKSASKKNKAKGKTTQGKGGSVPQQRGTGTNRKVTTAPPNADYSDIEVDENGNPVVLKEEDIPEEHDADPKSANQSSSADDLLEDFPPYGGDYTGAMDEGPVNYPDENPAPPPKRNKKNKGGNKKNKGKKGGKKANTNKKKKKKQGLLDPGEE